MPSFPDSVWAPTAKASGNTIQAAHVNDAQDEIVAIEGGYRNGTAPLNSSGSTVARLSVAGGSTFAGNIACTGTIGSSGARLNTLWVGQLEASSGAGGAVDAARLALSDTVALGNNSTVAVTWSTAHFKTNSSMHSTAANTERMVPQSTGIYGVAVEVGLNGTVPSTGFLEVTIEDSSNTVLSVARVGPQGERVPNVHMFALKRFDVISASPWVRVVALQRNASTNSLDTAASFAHFYHVRT